MSTSIIVKPTEDYFVAFLSTRGIRLALENPDVIHYFGDSKRKLKKLIAEYNPDLTLIHNPKAFDLDYKFSFALDEIHCDKDIYKARQVNTNALELTRLYYQSLGLERTLHNCSEKNKKEKKQKLQIDASVVKKILAIMMWN